MSPVIRNVFIVLVLMLLAYAGGRYLQPAEIQIQKEEIIKFKEIVKKDVIVIRKETKLPDGTVIVEETTTDKSTISSNKDIANKESTTVENVKSQWKVNALAGYDVRDKDMVYGLEVQKRFIGPVSLGAFGTNKQQIGISIGIEF